jgi:hypothetical protein
MRSPCRNKTRTDDEFKASVLNQLTSGDVFPATSFVVYRIMIPTYHISVSNLHISLSVITAEEAKKSHVYCCQGCR